MSLLPKTKVEMLPFDRFSASVDSSSNLAPTKTTQFNLPKLSNNVNYIEFSYTLTILSLNYSAPMPNEGVTISIAFNKINPLTNQTTIEYTFTDKILSPQVGEISKSVKTGSIKLDNENFIYKWSVSLTNVGLSSWGSRNTGSFNWARANYITDSY